MKQLYFVTFLLFILTATACKTQHFYRQEEYSFYQKNFPLPDTALLRTDGVYVLDVIRTGDTARTIASADRQIYKFYPGGQVNLVLNRYDSLESADDYRDAFNKRPAGRTLFQGYYKVTGNKLVIQQMSTPRAQFYYSYFRLTPDSIIQVSSTLQGKGTIKARHYTGNYEALYRYVPVDGVFVTPNW
ncbi:hypothetical protein [Chitinophaga arvensicola]|uniref:LPS export ABC transporter protein LptC n=1 Tax=Chitinophaga arvensicola TaxID=29529 RepID=A0A1I0S8J8_9BACT|nr:hypothetical protein [Chitinophaga arvensicola]SEW51070.1 hypothetical protein SAMN04488122_4106 [Chitinophaga arvensicola]